jgi:hypothetical protein
MKSILSKTMKYPKSKASTSVEQRENRPAPRQVLSPNTTTTASSTSNDRRIDIHEISTQSIIQTSALLHLLNNSSNDNNAVVVTPTNQSTGNDDTTTTTVPFRSMDLIPNDDDSDTVQSNGASISDDDEDSEDAVVVTVVPSTHCPKTSRPTNDKEDREVTSYLEPNDMVISEECSVRVSSPLGEPKEVRFMDDEDLRHRRPHFDDEQQQQEQEQESLVLHEQLRNVLQDLSAEKAMRFRKEKSLVQLAKQLKKRNLTIQSYETKLIQMAKFINALQLELQQYRHLPSPKERAPEEEGSTTEGVLPTPQDESTSLQDTIQMLRTELQDTQLQLQIMQTERQPVLPNMDEIESNNHVVPTKSEAHSNTTTTASKSRIHPFLVIVYLYGFVVVVTTVWYSTGMPITTRTTNILIQNLLCAPIRPGTKIVPHKSSDTTVYDAPWWVPTMTSTSTTATKTNLKSMMHATFCPLVPRTSLHWTGDKLMIYDMTGMPNDDHTTSSTASSPYKKALLLQGRGPAGVQFHYFNPNDDIHDGSGPNNVIQLLRTHRAGIVLPAPWIRSRS